jgi:hypothetical protein
VRSKKLEFWNRAYPFKDFLLISSKKEIKKDKIGNINENLNNINLNMIKLNQYESINNYIISSDLNINNEDKFTLFSGMIVYNGEFYFGEKDLESDSYIDFINSTGMFTVINEEDKSLIISQDTFGCGNLFYAEYEDGIYISNRYHLLLLVLSWFGFKGGLDKYKTMYWIYFNYGSIFKSNAHHNMDIKGVYNLPINKYIYVDKYGWDLKEKEKLNCAIKGISDKSYEENIRLGIKDVLENVNSIFNNNNFDKYVVDISGGFDSRVALSAVSNFDYKSKNLQAYTSIGSGKDDLEIGNGLRKLMEIPLYKDDREVIYPKSLDEQLNIWRSYFLGTYHRLGASAWSNTNNCIKSISITGGMGEFFRAKYLSSDYSNILRNNNLSITKFSKNLVDRKNEFIKDSQDIKGIYNLFENTIENDLIGETIEEKLENYHLFFALRYHFGMNSYSSYHNKPNYHVLMSNNLITASKMLTNKDRVNERFMLELTEKLNPRLAWAPYENKKINTKSILNNISLKHYEFKNYNTILDYNTDDWALQNNYNLNHASLLMAKRKGELNTEFYREWSKINEFLRVDIIKGYKVICEYIGFYSDEFEKYLSNENLSKSDVNVIYSKIMSLIDQIEIFN